MTSRQGGTYMSYANYPPSPAVSRSNRPPPPLRLNTHASSASSQRSAGPSPSRDTRPQVLYDLPRALESPGVAPSARPRPGGLAAMGSEGPRVRSPPGTPGGRSRSTHQGTGRRQSNDTSVYPRPMRRASDQGMPLPPPPRRETLGRATTPLGSPTLRDGLGSPSPGDLQLFAHHCRQFYFIPNPPQGSASYISTTLATLPPSHRSAYTKLQSSLRSLAHLHHLRVRISSFHALISSTVASASLTPLARTELSSSRARTERRERLGRFISTWCTTGAGGVEPFFRGLWAVMRAQSRGGEDRGGAGQRRVVWEVDDAVFLESGGNEFMHEAVILLKGVLGFVDQPLTSPPKLRRIRTIPRSYSDARLRRAPLVAPRSGSASPRKPLPPHQEPPQEQLLSFTDSPVPSFPSPLPAPPSPDPGPSAASASSATDPNRSRAISDPFLDSRAPTPRTVRTPSGRGPAPPPPPSRRNIPNPLQSGRPTPESVTPALTPSYSAEPLSHVDSPLLPGYAPEPSSVISALEAAAEAVRPRHPATASERDLLLRPRGLTTTSHDSKRVTMSFPSSLSIAIAEDKDDEDDLDDPTEDDIAAEEAELNKPRFRLWTVPAYLSDQELEALMALFPSFIPARRRGKGRGEGHAESRDVRFPLVRPGGGLKDLESGGGGRYDTILVEGQTVAQIPKVEVEVEEGVIRHGTGRMWAGTELRCAGWEGGRWFRFKRWWRRLFGLG